MRAIEVSTDVFAAIWALRIAGESCEDDILRRLFATACEPTLEVAGAIQRKKEEDVMVKPTWANDIVHVLQQCGGKARLGYIYSKIAEHRATVGRSTPASLEATVRRTLEDHCSGSDNFRGQDLFEMPDGKGAGVWALKVRR